MISRLVISVGGVVDALVGFFDIVLKTLLFHLTSREYLPIIQRWLFGFIENFADCFENIDW